VGAFFVADDDGEIDELGVDGKGGRGCWRGLLGVEMSAGWCEDERRKPDCLTEMHGG
jgi:hypothetical protein